MGAMTLSKYLDDGTFSRTDRTGACIALAGVVMVVQPDGIFKRTEALPLGPHPDSFAKLKGLSCGAIGVLGTIVSSLRSWLISSVQDLYLADLCPRQIALTTMRRIGSKAHPLMVVNYFALVLVLVAAMVLIIEQPVWPYSFKSWGFLIIVGVFGGLMVRSILPLLHRSTELREDRDLHQPQEFLLTAGISGDRSSASTVMIYSQVLWALAIDRIVWHVSMNIWTFVGVGGIVGSLMLVSLAKEFRGEQQKYESIPPSDESGTTIHEIDLDDIHDAEEANHAL